MPPHGRQTVTFDNGTEFAGHYHLHALGIEIFFCDPHAPWQKGGIENAIGRLRRTLPRKTDLATLSDQRFHHLVHAYNHIPRKDLGYVTPAEIFIHQVVHLKCESTMPQRRLSPVKFRRVIFIGVEGKSDRAFAKFLRRCCDKDGLHLHLKIATGYDGRSVVVVQEATCHLTKHSDNKDISAKLVLLDRDRIEQDRQAGRDAQAVASESGLKIIFQNLNLEGLLIRLHEGYESRQIATGDSMAELQKVWPEYRKSSLTADQLIGRFDVSDVRRAARHDEELRKLLEMLGL